MWDGDRELRLEASHSFLEPHIAMAVRLAVSPLMSPAGHGRRGQRTVRRTIFVDEPIPRRIS